MTPTLSQDLVASLQGTLTEADVAARHGLSVAEVRLARDAYLRGLSDAARSATRRSRAGALTLGALAALLTAAVARDALAGTCATPPGFPASLGFIAFCAGSPAVATEVNTNTTTIVSLVQQKVGTLGNNVVDMGARLKSCAGSPCYCDNANERPLSWTAQCVNVGHALYDANFVTSSTGLRGVDVRCYHAFNFSVAGAYSVQLLCARLAVP